MDQDFPDNNASYFNSAKKRKADSILNNAISTDHLEHHCNVDLNNNIVPFGSGNLPHNNRCFGDHHNHQTQPSTALKKDFLFLSSDWNLYHMDHLPNLPYFSSSSKQNNNVVYHPLKNNVLINTKSYAEITFRTDSFFLGDDQGQYEKTVEATAIDFLMHCEKERRLYVARSIVIPEKENAEELAKQLINA